MQCFSLLARLRYSCVLSCVGAVAVLPIRVMGAAAEESSIELNLSWGHRSESSRPFLVKLAGNDVRVSDLKLEQCEPGEWLADGSVTSSAGKGDVDGLSCTLQFATRSITPITDAQQIWKHLFRHGDSGAAQRLQADPAYRPDPRKLTIELDPVNPVGFSLTIDQLLTQKQFWFPELDVFVSVGKPAVSFATYLQSLEPKQGQRVLDTVARDPEATYSQYTARWEDMGSITYTNPYPIAPGHIVGLGWDSALHKFGVDRLAEVRNDYGEMERFHLRTDFGDAQQGLVGSWKGQRLEAEGLPIITTRFEKDGVRCEVEQFGYPLDGPPKSRRGDIKMVLLQKVTLTELTGVARKTSVRVIHERDLEVERGRVSAQKLPDGLVLEDDSGQALLAVAGVPLASEVTELTPPEGGVAKNPKVRIRKTLIGLSVNLAARGTSAFVVKLPSPALPIAERSRLLELDYAASRAGTIQFWNDSLSQGALFRVPEEAVNTLFRANLWHALRLPRRHGGEGADVKMDLPYSNFAYDQLGTPWPVNQSVYVDYMLYDLRGYHAISAEEHLAMYRNNQETNGHVGGFANWGVYTPGMLYSVAQHYLLSGDRASFDRLLPKSLRALDWCLGEMKRASNPESPVPGLMRAPLNDMAHQASTWAFNQAYFVAGVDLFGRALAEIQHPRAAECRAAARSMRDAVERGFARASVRSPAVQLADGTWSRYVPCDAEASGRLLKAWYPNDVDTGPLHLPRLKALDPKGPLTTAMLHDHEDNLFIHQWGTINEPVYNMQGTAYLLRDEPKAAIRTFYSTMACAFSHSVFEPVEHRWGWPQYFGPPSTDGAWFELLRNMLIHEREDDHLVLFQATPRAWLEQGKRIEVKAAPTYFGPLSVTLDSRSDSGELTASVDMPGRKVPAGLVVRFRHPTGSRIKSVSVDGRDWQDFDPAKEWVRIPHPAQRRYVITTHY